MKKETAFRVHQPAQGQTKEEARSILRHCIDQLATTSVGDPDWTDATNLLGQIDREFAPIQLKALADERYQICRALSVALSRIGPSILDNVVFELGHGSIRHDHLPVHILRHMAVVIDGVITGHLHSPIAKSLGDFLEFFCALRQLSLGNGSRSFGHRIAGHRRDMGEFFFYLFKCFFSHCVVSPDVFSACPGL